MISLPTAILLAGAFIGAGIGGGCYFLYKFFVMEKIFRASSDPKEIASLHRAILSKTPKPPKVVAEMPDLEIGAMADNPKAYANLQRQQTVSLSGNY